MDRSTDNDVLDACAKTLEFLCTEGTAIYTRCDVARSTLIDTLVNKYKEAMDDWRSLIEGVIISFLLCMVLQKLHFKLLLEKLLNFV